MCGPMISRSSRAFLATAFTGDYDNSTASPGAIEWLKLARDGSYEAAIVGSPTLESGAVEAPATVALPFVFTLRPASGATAWVASVVAYDRRLHVVHEDQGAASILTAVTTVGPNEALCDATRGSWTDDDADRTTGLFCRCPAATAYIPSEGGCVP